MRRTRRLPAGLVVGLIAGAVGPLAAPVAGQAPALGAAERESRVAESGGPGWLATPPAAFAGSLVVPGAGQAALGARRWILYGLAEVGLWAARLDALGDERRYRDGYRDLAWEAARLRGDGPRQDGGWGYYEAMSHYVASGAYDAEPAQPGLQPEPDPATFNGVVWELARRQFLPGGVGAPGSPAYDSALAYYDDRAAGPEFLWSWAGQEADLDRFRDLIDRTDAEARLARRALGLVLANHLVSAVDAYVLARLRMDDRPRLRGTLEGGGPALRWHLSLEIPTH